VPLVVAGISFAGMVADVPLWLLSIALAAIGIGLANTGSLGLLIGAVPVERIVTAMVIWSQVGILGYLLGPLAGGLVADVLGQHGANALRVPTASRQTDDTPGSP
jgi:MFS family permease